MSIGPENDSSLLIVWVQVKRYPLHKFLILEKSELDFGLAIMLKVESTKKDTVGRGWIKVYWKMMTAQQR